VLGIAGHLYLWRVSKTYTQGDFIIKHGPIHKNRKAKD
jgi:hypothetical protein